MKKILFVLIALTSLFMLMPAAQAATDDLTVIVNGKTLEFEVAPQIINNRTMVPLRAIFEEFGALVEWDDSTKTVTAKKDDTLVILTIGSVTPTVNGQTVEIDQPGVIVDGRTLAPLRFVGETFGGVVNWDETNRIVNITYNINTEQDPGESSDEDQSDTKLLYQGHGSFRIISKSGTVIYVDPYAGEGYDKPANIVLITHEHQDHNKIGLVNQKTDCEVIRAADALEGNKHNSFEIGDIKIESVEANNSNHSSESCVGYLISVDGILIYAAGDTSKTKDMETFAAKKIDYALLPCDGVYNMGLEEAAECAELIGAKHNIPIHMKPGALFDKALAEKFNAPNRLIVEAGGEIVLSSENNTLLKKYNLEMKVSAWNDYMPRIVTSGEKPPYPYPIFIVEFISISGSEIPDISVSAAITGSEGTKNVPLYADNTGSKDSVTFRANVNSIKMEDHEKLTADITFTIGGETQNSIFYPEVDVTM